MKIEELDSSLSTVVVVGRESVGKSQLISSLTGCTATVGNFRGTTIACECYECQGRTFVDTPGIVRDSDSVTTRAALSELESADVVLLVAQATQLDDDLAEILPLAAGKRGLVAVTFWDKVQQTLGAEESLSRLSRQTKIPFIALDARQLDETSRDAVASALDLANLFPEPATLPRVGWKIEPRPGIFEHPWLGPLAAIIILLAPAVAAVYFANWFAGWADGQVRWLLAPLIQTIKNWPDSASLFKVVLAGDYGLLTMGPALFVWALPTVLIYSLLAGSFKASGLIDRLDVALHRLVLPLGLSGRDLVRVLMGFGCNVPAVINTRSCSGCSRGNCISAIAFGSACSYQLPAAMAVFAAIGRPSLTIAYLGYLLLTTCLYLRMTSSVESRSHRNRLLLTRRSFLVWPRPANVWRESRTVLREFFLRAMPIFLLVSIVSSALAWLQVLPWLGSSIQPLLGIFRLPEQTALPLVVSALRKDGILLLTGEAIPPLTGLQALTAVYLASVMVPCLVTAWTIAREQSWTTAGSLLIKQFCAGCSFAALLAWGGNWLGW